MQLNEKKILYNLFSTLQNILDKGRMSDDYNDMLKDCFDAINVILEYLNSQDNIPVKTVRELNNVIKFTTDLMNKAKENSEKNIRRLKEQISLAQNIFKYEVNAKIKVLFMPYKVTMWDSLETVYQAALKDPDCEAKVVPIPFYEISNNSKTPKYEGDLFPKDIEITHYNDYDLDKERPDIIFVHNIYDQYNTITQVYEEYFTTNLKKYTDMLVFVPYHISSFIEKDENRFLAYDIPTINNVDKIILVGNHVKKAAIKDGVPEEKLLVLGSPKFDKIINSMKNEIEYPEDWVNKIKDKTVFTLNTGCMFFSNNPYYKIALLTDFLNIPNIVDNSVLIWRPHPLTEAAIRRYTPGLMDYYEILTKEYIPNEYRYKNIILDQTEDYIPSLLSADVLISGDGSLLRSYLATGKKVLFYHNGIAKSSSFLSESIIPAKGFYYFYDKDDNWPEILKKLARGIDPLAQERNEIIRKFYVNVDGTCGEKVYNTIKDCVLTSL